MYKSRRMPEWFKHNPKGAPSRLTPELRNRIALNHRKFPASELCKLYGIPEDTLHSYERIMGLPSARRGRMAGRPYEVQATKKPPQHDERTERVERMMKCAEHAGTQACE